MNLPELTDLEPGNRVVWMKKNKKPPHERPPTVQRVQTSGLEGERTAYVELEGPFGGTYALFRHTDGGVYVKHGPDHKYRTPIEWWAVVGHGDDPDAVNKPDEVSLDRAGAGT
jgi:hypothetical protein